MTGGPAIPNAPATTPSPNDLLASQIGDALVAAGLIKDKHPNIEVMKLFGMGYDHPSSG